MHVFVCTLAVLGAIGFLTVCYSFWVACVIIYFISMMIVTVIAFAGRSRPSGRSKSTALNDTSEEIITEGQAASEDLKAA